MNKGAYYPIARLITKALQASWKYGWEAGHHEPGAPVSVHHYRNAKRVERDLRRAVQAAVLPPSQRKKFHISPHKGA